MLLGYNTNGFAHHDPFDALEILAEIGYQSVAITLDHGPLNPFAADWPANLERLKATLRRLKLKNVIETGARFLLDPRHKHEPTLVSAERSRTATSGSTSSSGPSTPRSILDSDCVSLWSGIRRDDATDEAVLERLAESLRAGPPPRHQQRRHARLRARARHVHRHDEVVSAGCLQWIDAPHLQLTLDVGHLWCQGELPIADYIARWGQRIVNVHIEDMRAGVHEHLMFGEGRDGLPANPRGPRQNRLQRRPPRRTQPPQPRSADSGQKGVSIFSSRSLRRCNGERPMTDGVPMNCQPTLAIRIHSCPTTSSSSPSPASAPQDLAAMPNLSRLTAGGDRATLTPSFPAVTWPVQANMLTGKLPREHGVIANGFYWRDKHEVEMWTAWNDNIQQPQIWDLLHQKDPKSLTSAVWFPMLSKGCGADYICMPAPIHNPDGSESLWCYTKPVGTVRHACATPSATSR